MTETQWSIAVIAFCIGLVGISNVITFMQIKPESNIKNNVIFGICVIIGVAGLVYGIDAMINLLWTGG